MKAEARDVMTPPKALADCIAFMLTHYDVWSATPQQGEQAEEA